MCEAHSALYVLYIKLTIIIIINQHIFSICWKVEFSNDTNVMVCTNAKIICRGEYVANVKYNFKYKKKTNLS